MQKKGLQENQLLQHQQQQQQHSKTVKIAMAIAPILILHNASKKK